MTQEKKELIEDIFSGVAIITLGGVLLVMFYLVF